nr:MAG TPA: hypothetical protein [Caudoviricetes sp.]
MCFIFGFSCRIFCIKITPYLCKVLLINTGFNLCFGHAYIKQLM